MASPFARRLAVALASGVVAVLAAGAGSANPGSTSASGTQAGAAPLFARFLQNPPGTFQRARLARLAVTWVGGPVATSTGETVTVLVSSSLDPSVTPQAWAEFISHLTHGTEISKLTAHLATLEEVEQLCGGQALGCYGDNELIAIGTPLADGTTPDEVIRHEYGHHIAWNRSNAPWIAVDWGPKYWSSAAGVCARVNQGSAYPGDEALHYDQNPGEAWAETYRLLDERKNGITTASWQIISTSFFPTEAAYQAAEQDVLHPWTAGHTASYQRTFTKKGKKVWVIRLQTPLDGAITVSARVPKGGQQDIALLGPTGAVLKKAFWSGTRTKRIVTSVCGQRSLALRVTQKGAVGLVAVTTATP